MGVRQYRLEYTMVNEKNAREVGKFFALARHWLDEAEKMALRTGVVPNAIQLMRTTFRISPETTTEPGHTETNTSSH